MGWAVFLQSLVGTGRRSEGCPPRRAQWVGVSQHVPRHEGQPSPAAAEGAEAGIVGGGAAWGGPAPETTWAPSSLQEPGGLREGDAGTGLPSGGGSPCGRLLSAVC